ncbi:ribosome-assembly protein 3-domain-containing protein [Russula dissimulans]|nr:ribosome-assembly protein 3-domain-containing protein [Russula dissimulans]
MPTTAPRKRNRKRKRRLASSSSSSPSSSSDSSSDETSTKTPVRKAPLKKQATPSSVEEPSSPSSSSSSSSDSDNDDVPFANAPVAPPTSSAKPLPPDSEPATARRRRSPSPSPPPADAPPFLPPEGSSNRAQDEQALRDRFRQFWMASVADAFGDDLEQIRKEPDMTKSRLALLIDSLASGGEVFSSHVREDGGLNEMDVVLNGDHDI